MFDNNVDNYIDDPDIPIKMPDNIQNKPTNTKVVKRKKRTLKPWVWVVLLLIFLGITSLSIVKIVLWEKDNQNTEKIVEELLKEIENDYEFVNDTEETELVNAPEEEKKESDYWYYITFPLVNVDFTDLLKKNSNTVAWINVNNTNINYPVVQASDNDYYLKHSYDKSRNEAGWVFMDYRNNSNFDNKNTIIYAHSRLDKTMFGSLSKTLKNDWYTNKDNHIIRISTPTENSLWQVFSVYVIKEETYYIKTNFQNDETYEEFLDTIQKRSKHDFKTELTANDKILTLSTCYSNTERTVVHAKLLKRSSR